jgi:hemerythrin
MPLFSWYNRYSINNDEIDNQHKKLFDIFNKLYDYCVGNDKTYPVDNVINDLISYSDYHFMTEEQYMKDINYSEIRKQIEEHDIFRQKVLELKHENRKGETEHCHELVLFLSKWILNHILKEDKKLAL